MFQISGIIVDKSERDYSGNMENAHGLKTERKEKPPIKRGGSGVPKSYLIEMFSPSKAVIKPFSDISMFKI